MKSDMSTHGKTRELLVEALSVSEQIKNEYRDLQRQNDVLENLLRMAEEALFRDR